MGQKHPGMCCMGKENPDAEIPDLRKTRMMEREVSGLRHGVKSLRGGVSELQGEMERLREENAGYVRANRSLTSQNNKLNKAVEEQGTSRRQDIEEHQFTIVEEHYKDIERHRRAVDDGEELHHSAGGRPPRAGDKDAVSSPAAKAKRDKACYIPIREVSRETEQATSDAKGLQASGVFLKDARPSIAKEAGIVQGLFPEPSLNPVAGARQ